MTTTSKTSYTPTERTDGTDREVLEPLDAAKPEQFKAMVRRLAGLPKDRGKPTKSRI